MTVLVSRQCNRQCLFSELSKRGPGCRLPWMPVELPVCSTAEHYQTMLNYTRLISLMHTVWHMTWEERMTSKYYEALER